MNVLLFATNNRKDRGRARLDVDSQIAKLGSELRKSQELTNEGKEEIYPYRIKWLSPVCKECANDWFTCDGCGAEGPEEIIGPEIMGKYVVCKKCLDSNAVALCKGDCGKLVELYDAYEGDDALWCYDCWKENFGTCDVCGETRKLEKFIKGSDGSYYCSAYRTNKSCADEMPGYETHKIDNVIYDKESNDLKFAKVALPLDAKNTNLLLQMLKSLKTKPYTYESFEATLDKYPQVQDKAKEELKIYVSTCIDAYKDIKSWQDLGAKILKTQQESNSLQALYPQIKGLSAVPVKIQADEVRGKYIPSFTLTLNVPSEVLNLAERLFGEENATIAHELLTENGHHAGAMAYARISGNPNEDTLVINNLQTDSHIRSVKRQIEYLKKTDKEKEAIMAAAKWFLATYKNWPVYLLHAAKTIAKKLNKKMYITGFDIQQKKWNYRVPERSKDVYETIPERMGMAEDYDYTKELGNIVEGFGDTGDADIAEFSMRRVARLNALKGLKRA